MTTSSPLCIGFSLSPTWLSDDALRTESYSVDFYIDIAQQAEAAKLDFVFKPDSLTISADEHAHAPRQGSLDPMQLLAAIAVQTQTIGLVGTLSTTFVPPYLLARQTQSLHWLSNGRAGWNIVTSLDGAMAFGFDAMPSATARYERAREATELVQRLWASYDGNNRQTVNHNGKYYRLNGVLSVPQHPSGAVPLFQAGASDSGRDFAADVADAIFAATPDIDAAATLKADLQHRAAAQGRDADAVRVLPGLYLFLAETQEKAQALYAKTHAAIPRQRRLTALSSLLGFDCHDLPDDTMIDGAQLSSAETPIRSRTHSDLLRRLLAKEALPLKELLQRPEVIGSAHWVIIGTADEALAEIQRWHAANAIDGFIALPGGSVDSCRRFFSDLMPKLQQAGLARQEYSGKTLIEHLGKI